MPYSRANYRDKWRIERQAAAVRRKLRLDELEPVNPWLLADEIPAHVFYPEDFGDEEFASKVRGINWDGFAFSCDGTLMVLLNPSRSLRRQTATLMEELSHHLLSHRPSSIKINPLTGILERSYDRSQEAEAYDLGAAILLPKERIQREVDQKRLAHEVAADHGCSDDLVIYRIKRMRLWKRYESYAS